MKYVLSFLPMGKVRTFIPVILLVLFLAGLAAAGFFYYKYLKAQEEIQTIKTDPNTLQKAAQEETKKLVAEVGKLMSLPEENPTVATVTDVDKLKEQLFFQKAKNGDKVLIFTNAKKAILYDPTAKRIIDVAPVNIGSASAQTTAPEVQEVKIVLRNGTPTNGLTAKLESEVKKALPEANIIKKENASRNNYQNTTVVVLNETLKDRGESLAKSLNSSVGSLPEGEVKPSDADILIILGADKI